MSNHNYLLANLRLLLLLQEHKPPTTIIHATLSQTILSTSFTSYSFFSHLLPIQKHNVFFGLPLFCSPSPFQFATWLVMQFDGFYNLCTINFYRLLLISSSTGSQFLLLHSRLLLIVSGLQRLNILRRKLFKNT